MENTFAPVPDDASDEWLQILLDIVGVGAAVILAPIGGECKFFITILLAFELTRHSVIAGLPFFAGIGAEADTVQDVLSASIGGMFGIGKDISAANTDA
jgi:hypothetical protein